MPPNPQTAPSKKKTWGYFSTLMIIAIVLFAIGKEIYKNTIISGWVLFAVTTAGALIACWIWWKKLRRSSKSFWTALLCCGIGGAIFFFLFLFLNCAFPRNEIIREEFPFVRVGMSTGIGKSNRQQPYVVINFHGREKDLDLPRDMRFPIAGFNVVKLEYKKGLFGFPYIVGQELR